MNTKTWLAGLLTGGSSALGAHAAPVGLSTPVTAGNFLRRNTADLVSLCNARPGDLNRVAATHLCKGFLLGICHHGGLLKDHYENAKERSYAAGYQAGKTGR